MALENELRINAPEFVKAITSETVQVWKEVVDDIRTAIVELIDVDEQTMERLVDYFWPTSVELLEKATFDDADIAEKVLKRAQELSATRREVELDEAQRRLGSK